jgi:hypothetical protein
MTIKYTKHFPFQGAKVPKLGFLVWKSGNPDVGRCFAVNLRMENLSKICMCVEMQILE